MEFSCFSCSPRWSSSSPESLSYNSPRSRNGSGPGWMSRASWPPSLGMLILQIVVAAIPGEPLEIAAGYAFGALEGTLLCMFGAFIGRVAVFLLVRRFGTKAVEVFFPLEKLNTLSFLQNRRKLTAWVFFLFFLPGTPKDLLCYVVGLTDLPLKTWLIVSAIAPFPSIVTSTIGGDALGMGNYTFALLVFVATMVISGGGLLVYRAICQARERSES